MSNKPEIMAWLIENLRRSLQTLRTVILAGRRLQSCISRKKSKALD